MVEAGRQRIDAGARGDAETGLVADDPAVRRRADDGTEGLCPEGRRYTAAGDCRGRTAGGTAGRMWEIPGIARFAGMAPGKCRGHGLAEHDRTGVRQVIDYPAGTIGHMTLECRGTVFSRFPS